MHPPVHGIESAKVALPLEVVEHPIEERPQFGRIEKRCRHVRGGYQRQAQRGKRSLEHAAATDLTETVIEVARPDPEHLAQICRRQFAITKNPALGGAIGDVVAQDGIVRRQERIHLDEFVQRRAPGRDGEAALCLGDPICTIPHRLLACRRIRGHYHRGQYQNRHPQDYQRTVQTDEL